MDWDLSFDSESAAVTGRYFPWSSSNQFKCGRLQRQVRPRPRII